MIASGPAYLDASNCEQAFAIVSKYGLQLSQAVMKQLRKETPKVLTNVEAMVTGSIRQLCADTASVCNDLGYRPIVLTD